jgi:pyruvate/2-oxoglutarate dehydrogenase complex dihydrolipoamide dehydrogenase (E3) component
VRAERFDVVVIGGGGTGSEIAFQLADRSELRVAIAERDRLGGECNHYGCVPTKVMLKSAKVAATARDGERFGVRVPGPVAVDLPAVRDRVRRVIDEQSGAGAAPFLERGVEVFLQEIRLTGPHDLELADGTAIHADRIVLATGTEASLPPVPGLADGPYWTNREAIWQPDAAPARLVVIGAGAIGVEFSQIFARFGSAVTLVEIAPHILPNEDAEAAAALLPVLEADGIDVRAGVRIDRAEHRDGAWSVALVGDEVLTADEVLVATGRRPVFDGHDLEAAGIDLLPDGRPVLDETLRSTADNVWAAGDATGELLFTHVGTYEAELVVDDILGIPRPRSYRVVPRVTFCDPEVASVGLTERQAADDGHALVTSVSSIADNERAHIEGELFGLVKLVADADTGELLGGHVVGEDAGAMIHEIAVAMVGHVPVAAVAGAIHAYPTLSESVKGAFVGLAERLG